MMIMENIPNTWGSLMREKAKELGKNNCWERNIPSFSQGFLFREKVVPKHVAEMAIKGLNEVGKVIKGSKVLIMGLTYKENVPDTRESPVREMVKELKEFGVNVYGYDPLLARKR